MRVAVYLAHLNPVTNAHVQIIEDLKKEASVKVMPVVFLDGKSEVNSRSFPFDFETRKRMIESVFGDTVEVLSNYTFHAPFWRYFPPLLSPYSWILRRRILEGVGDDYFTYTGDRAEGVMLRAYMLRPKVGRRKEISASSVKDRMYEAALGADSSWREDVPEGAARIIEEKWDVVRQYASSEDRTTRIAGMKFPRVARRQK